MWTNPREAFVFQFEFFEITCTCSDDGEEEETMLPFRSANIANMIRRFIGSEPEFQDYSGYKHKPHSKLINISTFQNEWH